MIEKHGISGLLKQSTVLHPQGLKKCYREIPLKPLLRVRDDRARLSSDSPKQNSASRNNGGRCIMEGSFWIILRIDVFALRTITRIWSRAERSLSSGHVSCGRPDRDRRRSNHAIRLPVYRHFVPVTTVAKKVFHLAKCNRTEFAHVLHIEVYVRSAFNLNTKAYGSLSTLAAATVGVGRPAARFAAENLAEESSIVPL